MGNLPHLGAKDKVLRAFLRKNKASEARELLLVDSYIPPESYDAIRDPDSYETTLEDVGHRHADTLSVRIVPDLCDRFELVPDHARAFGWPDRKTMDLVGLQQRADAVASAYWISDDLDLLTEALTGLTKLDLKILRKAYFAKSLLKVDIASLEFVGKDVSELTRIAISETAYLRQLHAKLRRQHDTDPVFGDDKRSRRLAKALKERVRATNPDTRLKRLKAAQRTMSLYVSQVLELVGSHKGKASRLYVSTAEMDVWTRRQRATEEWAIDHEMHDEEADVTVSMQALVYNRKRAQTSQMYAVAKGMQEIAAIRGWDYSMITLTLPGEWHSARTGTQSKRKSEWNHKTPEDAARELQVRWNRIATRIKQLIGKGEGLGFAMREPHDDGAPHLHCSLMASREALIAVRRYLIDQCILSGETVDEPSDVFETTKTHLLHFLAWKPADEMTSGKRAASPASYMFKYLTKGVQNADVAAWKSCVNIRQISWINFGAGFVGKWVSFYRTSRKDAEELPTDPAMLGVVADVISKNWGAVVGALTGILDGPELKAIREYGLDFNGDEKATTVGYEPVDGAFDHGERGREVLKKDLDREWTLRPVDRGEMEPVASDDQHVDIVAQHVDKKYQHGPRKTDDDWFMTLFVPGLFPQAPQVEAGSIKIDAQAC